VKAIADAIEEELIKQGEKPLAMEGYREGNWILIDCADLIVHVFNEDTRRFYDLERLWGRAARIDVGLDGVAAAYLAPQPLSFKEGELM
jgi:ribosome-associated protein